LILFLSDLQGRFEVVNAQIDHAESHAGRTVDAVVLPGDLGLTEPLLSRFFRRRGERFRRPFFYIEGNHEDFDAFDVNVERYADVMTHLPRGTAHTIAGRKFLALGGASYMDSFTTPERSLLKERDIHRCLRHPPDAVDIVLTHDCPSGIGMSGSPVFSHLPPPGFRGSPELLSHFHPHLWFFGHHHRWFQTALNGTRFFGLPEAWCGYALLHEDDRVDCIEHHILPPPTNWQRVLRWLRCEGMKL